MFQEKNEDKNVLIKYVMKDTIDLRDSVCNLHEK